MVLTVDHKETVHARVRRDPEFRRHLLNGVVEHLLAGEVAVAKILLNYYVDPTIGFEELGIRTGRSPESLLHMFGPEGDPRASELFDVIACLLRHEGLVLQVSAAHGELEGDDRAATEPVAAATQ
ncbi:MAG: hypothetical protein OXC06_14055 [Acidimicrobiaceae bacterium]|nr:hypothetical protein [Acidimicrobiaceae bacterium]